MSMNMGDSIRMMAKEATTNVLSRIEKLHGEAKTQLASQGITNGVCDAIVELQVLAATHADVTFSAAAEAAYQDVNRKLEQVDPALVR